MKRLPLTNDYRKCFWAFALGVSIWIGPARSAHAQWMPTLLDDIPNPSQTPPPASLGQQPFPQDKELNLTPSQTNTNQLNQLFQFDGTPDICAAGEGYITGDFNYLKYPGTTKEYRYQIQGQYGFTDQIAGGVFIPVITSDMGHTNTGMGDVGIYGQYKFDQLINPEIVDVTAQVDMILPTGDRTEMRDTGKFGIRPLLLAYKDFGQQGPGDFSLYGLFGFTISTNSDLRLGIAATYQYHNLVGIMELYDLTAQGSRPLLQVTPGLAYRGFGPWELSVGIPVGVNHGTPDWGVICKITYAFQN
jgi:hypothetical protein